MQTRMDAAGRVVIPKSLRDRLGLQPGQELEVHEVGAGIQLEPTEPSGGRIEVENELPVLAGDAPLTDDDVRALRDVDRR